MCVTDTAERLLRQDVFPSKVGSRTAYVRKSGILGTPCPTDPSFVSHKQSVLHKRYHLKNTELVRDTTRVFAQSLRRDPMGGERRNCKPTASFINFPLPNVRPAPKGRRCDPPLPLWPQLRSSCPVSVGSNRRPKLGLEAKEGYILWLKDEQVGALWLEHRLSPTQVAGEAALEVRAVRGGVLQGKAELCRSQPHITASGIGPSTQFTDAILDPGAVCSPAALSSQMPMPPS